MPKHVDAVPSLDSFRAPWETEGGTEAEIDKPKLKKYIHGLVTDKAKAQDARDGAQEQVTTLTAANEDLKTRAEAKDGDEATKKITKLEQQVADLTVERDKAIKDKTRSDLLREAGLTDKHAKYVTGETEDEIKKSIEDVKKDFGIEDPESSEDSENDPEDEGGFDGFVRPVSRLRTPNDPKGGKAPKEIDFEATAAKLVGRDLF